jgi:hypothetical protein
LEDAFCACTFVFALDVPPCSVLPMVVGPVRIHLGPSSCDTEDTLGFLIARLKSILYVNHARPGIRQRSRIAGASFEQVSEHARAADTRLNALQNQSRVALIFDAVEAKVLMRKPSRRPAMGLTKHVELLAQRIVDIIVPINIPCFTVV